MSDSKDSKIALMQLIGNAFKLEMKTDGGKYNIFFTGLIVILAVLYIATEPIIAGIYALCLKQPYKGLSFCLYIGFPVGWGLLCFLYMVFVADKMEKARKQIGKNND